MYYTVPTIDDDGHLHDPRIVEQINSIVDERVNQARADILNNLPKGNMIVGPGRPDVPETTEGAIKGDEAPGTMYYSTDSAGVGAYVWCKQIIRPTSKAPLWVVIRGDTGWRTIKWETAYPELTMSDQCTYLRRVNDTVRMAIGGRTQTDIALKAGLNWTWHPTDNKYYKIYNVLPPSVRESWRPKTQRYFVGTFLNGASSFAVDLSEDNSVYPMSTSSVVLYIRPDGNSTFYCGVNPGAFSKTQYLIMGVMEYTLGLGRQWPIELDGSPTPTSSNSYLDQ